MRETRTKMADTILPIRTPPATAYDCPDSQWENEERLSTSVPGELGDT